MVVTAEKIGTHLMVSHGPYLRIHELTRAGMHNEVAALGSK